MGSIRAVLVGVGVTGSAIARLLLDKGVEIVGAVDPSPNKVGRDVGEVVNLGSKLGVSVESDLRLVLSSRPADIAVIATQNYMADVQDQLRTCAEAGVNAITIAAEAIYPWRTSPTITAELDRLAKENGITLTGGGYQDTYLINMVAMLLGTANRVDDVLGRNSYNVDDYGAQVAEDMLVGRSVQEFEKWLANAEQPPSFSANDLHALAAVSGLTVKRYTRTTKPEVTAEDRKCKALGITVPAGNLIGTTDVEKIETEQGPTLRMEICGRVYLPGETDINEWTVAGDPNLWLENPRTDTRRTTVVQAVNRIPDVINARPGFVTIVDLPPLRYRHEPLDRYLT